MRQLLMLFFFILGILFTSDIYSQYFYVSFKSDAVAPKSMCKIYYLHLKTGVMSQDVYLPIDGFRDFKLPSNTSFEIVLDCQKPRIFIDKIFPKSGDSIIVNLDTRTFSYLNRKELEN